MLGSDTVINLDHMFDNRKNEYDYLFNRQQYIINNELSYKAVKKGILFPHRRDPDYNCGVWDCERTKLDIFTGTGSVINNNAFFPGNAVVKNSKEKVIFIGAFSGIYGHFITDSFRYLWFLKSKYYNDFKDYKLVYYIWSNYKMIGNYKRLLELAGLNTDDLIEICEPTQFEEIIVPDPSFTDNPEIPTKCFSKEYLDTINNIKANVLENFDVCNPKYNYNKIYLSFSKFKNRTAIGEKKLEKFFKDRGFKIIYPEKYTIDEQIAMMINCETLASTDGSLLHNCVFMNDNKNLIIIPRGSYTTSYQDALNYLRDYKCVYVDSSLSFLISKTAKANGPFYFYISEEMYDYFLLSLPKDYLKKNFNDAKKYVRRALKEAQYTNFDYDGVYGKKFYEYNKKLVEKNKRLKEMFCIEN